MRIATKLNVGVLVILAASVLANYFVLQTTIRPQFDAIETGTSLANHQRILGAIDQLAAKLGNSAQDYAFWDEAYDFARGRNTKRFISSSLNPAKETLQSLGVAALIFTDEKGDKIWGEAVDSDSDSLLPELAREIWITGVPIQQRMDATEVKAKSGLVKTSRGLMLLSVAPILKGDRSGPAAGAVILADLLDKPAIEQISGVMFSLEVAPAQPHEEGPTRVTSVTNTEHIVTMSLMKDISGAPAATLAVPTPRDVSKAGTEAILSAVWHMMLAAAAVIIALWLLVRFIVVQRIGRLKEHFTASAQIGRLSHMTGDRSRDEIGQLGASFNEMAEQVNHLRDALADSAYLSGLSEWAAGTLHNVRNSLSPINVTAWKLDRLFDDTWLANLKTTVKQLDDTDAPAELRAKLNSYLLVSTSRMIERAEQTKVMSGEITAASRTAEEIVAEFDKHTRHETSVEPVDLLPLIEDVCRKHLSAYSGEVALTLPEQSATVIGNRTIIRQILSNLVTNALEALAGRDTGKSIAVSLAVATSGNPRASLTVADNGEGIGPEGLKKIFRRGYSTRQHKHGGLGLHWCANAANGLGGSLSAESLGNGSGATFVLTLPTIQPALEKAA